MLQLIHCPLPESDESRPEVSIRTDRITLARRLWRGTADDGREFGFELTAPLKHGETVFLSLNGRYVIRQEPEPLLEISLDIAPSAAAGIGWAVGNLHLELCAEASRLLAPDEPAARQLLTRLQVPFRAITGIFRPARFARGQQATHDLGPGHKH